MFRVRTLLFLCNFRRHITLAIGAVRYSSMFAQSATKISVGVLVLDRVTEAVCSVYLVCEVNPVSFGMTAS